MPGRNAIIFITFVVILITLVLQGFTLSPLTRLLRIVGDNEEDREVTQARSASSNAGASALDRLEAAGGDPRLVAELPQISVIRSEKPNGATSSLTQMRLHMIAAERETVIAMRDRNQIDNPARFASGEFGRLAVLPIGAERRAPS
jgi:NhaP-type Na+/H+ or K+/H+ antiporter